MLKVYCLSITLLILLVIYIYIVDKTVHIEEEYIDVFRQVGLTDEELDRVSHDDDAWYYDSQFTCVGYGTSGKICSKSSMYCNGDNYGTIYDQALLVKQSIDNGGIHPSCPLMYSALR